MRRRLFEWLSTLVSQRPWQVLGAALLLCVLSVGVVEMHGVKMETRILDLLPGEDPAAIAYNHILDQYDSASQIIVGVKGGTKEEKMAFIDKLAPRLKSVTYTDATTGEKKFYVKHAVTRMDTEYLTRHGLMLTSRQDLENLETLFRNPQMADLLTAYNDFLEMEYIENTAAVTEREKEDGAISNLKAIVRWLEGVEVQDTAKRADWASATVDSMTIGDQYMFSQNNEMLIAMVVPTISMDRMEETMDGAKSLRQQVRVVQKDFPALNVRLTGMPVLSLEEMEVTEKDMGAGTLWSLGLILILFILAFRMWTAPLLAMINLVVGILWTLPVIALAFGRLNLMTTMFAIILVGLGIDFAIHLNAAYSTARTESDNVTDAISAMYRRVGNGVVTGALTTAVAFLVLAFTGLDAFVELGVILASGILLTLIASLTVLPAMYVVTDRVRQRLFPGSPFNVRTLPVPLLEKGGNAVLRWPVALVVVAMFTGVTVYLGIQADRAKFESNMLEIEPADMPSVLLHREVLREFEINPDFAMVSAKTVADARRITERMKKNRLVGQVDSVSEYVPSLKAQQRRIPVIRAIADHATPYLVPAVTAGLPTGGAMASFPPYMTADAISPEQQQQILDELDRLNMNVKEIGQMAFVSMKNRLVRQCNDLAGDGKNRPSRILTLKKKFSSDTELGRKVASWQRSYIPLLAERLVEMASTEPLTMDALPEKIRSRYLSDSGENLVTIYAAVDLWDGNKVDLFNRATQKVSDGVTGTAVLMDRLISLIGSRGTLATLLALGAVFLILLVDFRSFRYAFVGMLPLLFGFIWMVGIFTLLGKKFDVANVTAIPLILGIGIDDAVHILHGIQNGGIRSLPKVLKHTGRALVLTSATTAIAFGSIAGASHRGLAGMGILLTLGVISCLIISIGLLPAVARLVFRKGMKSTNPETEVSK